MPPIWNQILTGELMPPENSEAADKQTQLVQATKAALEAIYADVRTGLRETVGINCVLDISERCSVILDLPGRVDAEQIALAIDLENVEAWSDESGRVHVGISPWLSTKDVDQTVLSIVKVIHVLLGIHASDSPEIKSFGQKVLLSVAEIMNLRKTTKK